MGGWGTWVKEVVTGELVRAAGQEGEGREVAFCGIGELQRHRDMVFLRSKWRGSAGVREGAGFGLDWGRRMSPGAEGGGRPVGLAVRVTQVLPVPCVNRNLRDFCLLL